MPDVLQIPGFGQTGLVMNIQTLTTMAIVLFIFAATVCRFVGNHKRDPKSRLAKFLEQASSCASNLEQTYLPVLQQWIDGCPDCDKENSGLEFRQIVGSIVILADPLSTLSLASLLAICKEDIDSTLDDLHSVFSIPSDQESPVQLLHLSFHDFLIGFKEESWFWVDERVTPDMIATRCQEQIGCLRENMCGLDPPGKL